MVLLIMPPGEIALALLKVSKVIAPREAVRRRSVAREKRWESVLEESVETADVGGA